MPEELLAEVNGTPRPQHGFLGQAQSSAVSIKIAKILTEAHSGAFTVSANPDGGNLVSLSVPGNTPASCDRWQESPYRP